MRHFTGAPTARGRWLKRLAVPGSGIAETPLAVMIADACPVTDGHMLAIPRRHVVDYFDVRQPERNVIQRLLDEGRAGLRERDATIA